MLYLVDMNELINNLFIIYIAFNLMEKRLFFLYASYAYGYLFNNIFK